MRYIVIDSAELIVNAIEWDGETEWTPPAGCSVEASVDAEIGGTLIGGAYAPPPTPEPSPVVLTFGQLVEQSSTFAELKALVLAQGA